MQERQICHSCTRRRLVLFYISAKYHRNIPKGIPVTERIRIFFSNKTKGDNSKIKKARVINLVCEGHLPSSIKIFQRVFNLQSGQEVLRQR